MYSLPPGPAISRHLRLLQSAVIVANLAFLFPTHLTADTIVEGARLPSARTATIQLRLIESTHSVAESFDRRLADARLRSDYDDARDALQLLNGIVRGGVGARELGKITYLNSGRNTAGTFGFDGEMRKIDRINRRIGLVTQMRCLPYPDRSVFMNISVDYFADSRQDGIEFTTTTASGLVRLDSGWPHVVFRWDQPSYSRFLIATAFSAPTSRQLDRPGIETRMEFSVLRPESQGKRRVARKKMEHLPPFRNGSKKDIMSRFTAIVCDERLTEFSDGFLIDGSLGIGASSVEINPSRLFLTQGASFTVVQPWGNTSAAALAFGDLPGRFRGHQTGSDTHSSHISGNAVFGEPTGRHVVPPFSRGRSPDPEDMINHSLKVSEAPLYFNAEFETQERTPVHYEFEIRSIEIPGSKPFHKPIH